MESKEPPFLRAPSPEGASLPGNPTAPVYDSIPPLQDRNGAPVSFAQRSLWFSTQFDPSSPIYNRPTALRILGPLNRYILERSLNEILRRHEILRTSFQIINEEPVQQAHSPSLLPLPVEDLSRLKRKEQIQAAKPVMERIAAQPFDLESGPLVRWQLFRLAPQEHLLLFVTHHIVFDSWSERIFLNELLAGYDAFGNGHAQAPPGISIQYADYAAWMRKEAEGETFQKNIRYWEKKLAGPLPVLDLPISAARPARRAFHGSTLSFSIDPSLTKKLKDLSRQESATLFTTLLSAFAVLLYRYSGQEEILIGTTIAGRNRIELEPLIGCFINRLILRCDLSGEPSFQELAGRIGQVCQEAYDHQVSYEKLVETLQPERDPGRPPVFQVMFSLENIPPQTQPGYSLKVEPFELEMGVARFDLSVEMAERQNEIHYRMNYNTDLFDKETIQRMSGHYQTLLEGLLSAPGLPVGKLPLLTEAERRQLLDDWNDTTVDDPVGGCVHKVFEDQVKRTPDTPALFYDNQVLTYQELNRRANQLARYLQKQGVGPDMLVGLAVERSLEMIVGILGILKAGGAYLPLDLSFPKERLAFMLEDSGAKILITKAEFAESINPKLEESQGKTPDGEFQPWLAARTVVCLDADWPEIILESGADFESNAGPENLMYVIYTSGSTGKPKGVMINHHSVLNLMTGLSKTIYARLPAAPLRVGLNASISFDGSVKQLITLLKGHTLYIIPSKVRLDGAVLLDFIRRHRLDVLDCVPTQLKMLLAAGLLDGTGWQPLAMLTGGEAIDESTWQKLAEATITEFFNMYGPTECTVDSAIARVKDRPDRPVIGRPITNTQVYVLDSHQQPVPLSVPGELYIGGAGISRGYLKSPELTAEKFIRAEKLVRLAADSHIVAGSKPAILSDYATTRLYKTGDLVRWLPDGNLEFLGRIDRQVKMRGFRIELGEIENALLQHPEVEQAVVQDSEDAFGDKYLAAYLVLKGTTQIGREALRDFLRQRLPDYLIPTIFIFLEALPLTPNGKIDRRALPPPQTAAQATGASIEPVYTPLEEVISGTWAGVLGLERIGLQEDFFNLGGHSLSATRVMTRLRETFQAEFPLSLLFENPTVAGLAQAMLRASDQPQRLEQTAELFLSLEKLSPEEIQGMLLNQHPQGSNSGEEQS